MNRRAYSRAFAGLTPMQRRVYALTVRKACKATEIAPELGIQTDTVRQHLRQLFRIFQVPHDLRLLWQYEQHKKTN